MTVSPIEASDGLKPAPEPGPILEVDQIRVQFRVRRGLFDQLIIRAVDGVSLTLRRGETLALVGESGSGKSTTGRAIVQIEPLVSGEIRLNGLSLRAMGTRELRRNRRRLQMIFQDPYGSLNPRHTVETIVAEPMAIHGIGTKASRRERGAHLLEIVGMDPSFAARYPHALSGGQRQRVAIARALSSEPDIIICDEPVSALDVSIQAQIINLLEGLQAQLGVAYIFIAHDLAVVRHIADRVAVLYLGRIVEETAAERLYRRPLHPYTKALLSAVPIPNAKLERQRPGSAAWSPPWRPAPQEPGRGDR